MQARSDEDTLVTKSQVKYMHKSKIIGLFLVAGLFISIFRFIIFGGDIPVQGYSWSEMTVLDRVIGVYGIIGGLGIWFWMLVDFFKNRPKRFNILWGFSLIMFSYVAATLYFFGIYWNRKYTEE